MVKGEYNRMKTTGLILLAFVGVLIGSYTGFAVTVASMDTSPPTKRATPLQAVYYHEAGTPVAGSELQGSQYELQVTTNPQPATTNLQGNNNDTSILQPASSIQ